MMIRRPRWDSVQPKGLRRSVRGMPRAKVKERKPGSEDRTRVREQGLGLGGAKGNVFNAVYYVEGILCAVGHEATIRTESEGPRMRLDVCVHPPGSSLGLEYFGELWSSLDAVLDAESNIAGIGMLKRPIPSKSTICVYSTNVQLLPVSPL